MDLQKTRGKQIRGSSAPCVPAAGAGGKWKEDTKRAEWQTGHSRETVGTRRHKGRDGVGEGGKADKAEEGEMKSSEAGQGGDSKDRDKERGCEQWRPNTPREHRICAMLSPGNLLGHLSSPGRVVSLCALREAFGSSEPNCVTLQLTLSF